MLDNAGKFVPQIDGLQVEKRVVCPELLDELTVDQLRVGDAVGAAIIDEDPGHDCPTAGTGLALASPRAKGNKKSAITPYPH